jgi:hypothetical protein
MSIRLIAAVVLTTVVGVAYAQQQPGHPGMGGGMGGGMGMGGGPPAGGMQGQRGPGQGYPAEQPGMGMYGRGLDRNGDGLISRDEVRQEEQALQRLQERWQSADRNGDGMLDQGEFAAFQQQLRQGGGAQ